MTGFKFTIILWRRKNRHPETSFLPETVKILESRSKTFIHKTINNGITTRICVSQQKSKHMELPGYWCFSENHYQHTYIKKHTRLTMYYIRPFQYDCTSSWLYGLVLVPLRSVLVTRREYTCVFTLYTLPWRWTVLISEAKKICKAFLVVFTRIEQFVL